MAKPPRGAATVDERDQRDYPVLDLLDRLEELIEEMDELGVTTLDEIERRIAELDAQLADPSESE